MDISRPSLFARLTPNLHWRWTCPDSVDAIATDFIRNQNDWSRDDWMKAISYDNGFALRRRISAIYGVAKYYKHPTVDAADRAIDSIPGWNRRLWKTVGKINPELLVDNILTRVSELVSEIEDG